MLFVPQFITLFVAATALPTVIIATQTKLELLLILTAGVTKSASTILHRK